MIRNPLRTFSIALTFSCLILGPWADAWAADKHLAAIDSYPTTHHIRTLFLILMENHNWTGDGNMDIKGNAAAPYINKTLLPLASHAEHYYDPPGNHPSLPNYLWLEAGTNFGILDDGPPSQHHQSTTNHFVTFLRNAGISWRTYQENITGTNCPTTDGYPYAVKHNPFAYFDDIVNNYCISA